MYGTMLIWLTLRVRSLKVSLVPDPIVDFEASGFGHCFDTFWHVLRTHQNPAVKGLKHSRCYISEHVLASTVGFQDFGTFRRHFGHFWALFRRKSGTACLWLSVLLRVIFWNKIAAVVAQVLAQVLAVIVERAMAI